MSKQPQRADARVQKPEPGEAGAGHGAATRVRLDTRPQGVPQKFHEKLAEARRKLPSGPIGGSGRKTNVSRSR